MVDMETMKIKCPNCGAVLIVRKTSDMNGKSVRCTVCRMSNPFSAFVEVGQQAEYDPEETEVKKRRASGDDEEATDFEHNVYLRDMATDRKYRLKEGCNLVGRKTYKTESLADVPIETDEKCFSRSHFYVEMADLTRGCKPKMYLAKGLNKTFVNSELLETGEKIILQHGDVIRCAKLELKVIFE